MPARGVRTVSDPECRITLTSRLRCRFCGLVLEAVIMSLCPNNDAQVVQGAACCIELERLQIPEG